MEGVPELLPARMLNEFTYCKRLFHLEWVQSQFRHNHDTVEGNFHHRRVDRPAGAVPAPDDDADIRNARSVLVSSDRLGIIAKVDVLEGDDGAVVPVDTKRGHPPDNEHHAWEPERVQVCAQGLILRDAGYSCDRGVLYFADARTRVPVEFDDVLVHRTLELIKGAKDLAEIGEMPAPLVDSPKCPRCSLVGICLPDEVNTLRRRQQRPRRLLAQVSEARPMYVTEQGARIGHSKGRVTIKKGRKELTSTRMLDVSQVVVFGNVQISTQAMRAFFDAEVPVSYHSYGGWFSGMATGLPGKNVELRRRQHLVASRGGLDIARAIVAGKIANSRVLLRRNTRGDVDTAVARLSSLRDDAIQAVSVASLLGIEGAAAREYFQAFDTMLTGHPGGEFDFTGRNRRPPKDPVNALLSFVYAMIARDLTTTAHAVGFDPYLGFYHRPRFGRPALALDLAEEFRHLVGDSVVIQVVNNGEVQAGNFTIRAGGVALDSNGRRAVLRAYERRLDTELTHPIFGYRASYRRLYELQTRILAGHVMNELEQYEPLVTR